MIATHNRTFLLRELHALAVQITGEEVCLVEGDAGCCWSWNWSDRVITVDPDYLGEKAADVCRAVLLHESAHCAITRLQHVLPLERCLLYQDLLNVLEDLRIESWLGRIFPGCVGWLRKANSLIMEESRAKPWPANYQIQFLRGLLMAGHLGEAPTGAAPCVILGLKETRAAVEEQTLCHPASARGRAAAMETINAQQRMVEIFDRKIRPVWERLVALDEIEGRQRITTLMGGQGITAGRPRHSAIPRRANRGQSGGQAPFEGSDPLQRGYLERAAALSPLIDPLADEFIHLLETASRQRSVKNQRQGDRVNMRSAMQAEADQRLREKVWERRLQHTRFDPLVVLALDCSGSMQGERFDAAYDAIVLLSEVCLRSGLPMALWAFNNKALQVLAPHGQSDSESRRTRIDLLRKACGGGTSMHIALARILTSTELSQFTHPIVIVVGDGEPNDKSATLAGINRFQAAGIPILGIGIGSDTQEMASLFPKSVIEPNVGAMAHTLSSVLRTTLHEQIAATGAQPLRRAA
jgi:Mg-chelatase subunit ChlD